jgi:hypothetical protein
VGTGGDYDNEYQAGTWIPDVYRPYDVFELDVTNRDLEVRLVHGGADASVAVGKSTVFDQHLDTTHRELRDPSTPGGRLVADQIDALVHGRTSMFDDPGTRATLAFDGDRCSFDGAATATVGQPLRIRLVGDSEVPVWFSMVAFGPDLTDAEMTATVTAERRPIDDPPRDPVAYSFVLIEPRSEGEMTWVFVDDTLRWSSWCMPEADSAHPGAGLMYGASEVVLSP